MSDGNLSAFFGSGFDPRSIAPQTDFNAIPPGKYPVLIEGAEIKQTKTGTGHFIELTLSILDGPHKNRKVWDRLNIDNPNATAVEIATRTLAALGQAIGLSIVSDTTQLLNKACIASVKVKDDQNSVRTYLPFPQQTPQAPVQAPALPRTPVSPQAPVTPQAPVAPQAPVTPPQQLAPPWRRPPQGEVAPY